MISARPVGNDLTFNYALTFQNYRLLIDAGVLVRALEFSELINVAAHFTGKLSGMMLALDAHNNAFGVNGIDDAIAAGEDHCAGIARGDTFHPRAYDWGLRTPQRNPLPLHVRAHQRSVRVGLLPERDERPPARGPLLRTPLSAGDFFLTDEKKMP